MNERAPIITVFNIRHAILTTPYCKIRFFADGKMGSVTDKRSRRRLLFLTLLYIEEDFYNINF